MANVDIASPGGSAAALTAALRASLPFRGALVSKAADQTAANYSAGAMVGWDTESYDTDAIHESVTNPSRLTVPAGVTKVRLLGQVAISLLTTNVYCFIQVAKNGSIAYIGCATGLTQIVPDFPVLAAISPVLTVTAGDYFELKLTVQTDTSITVTTQSSWFAMEIIE